MRVRLLHEVSQDERDASDDEDWYCPECKNEDTTVKKGEKVKASSKKAKLPAATGKSKRYWGQGMATVGRTKSCTKVDKDFMGLKINLLPIQENITKAPEKSPRDNVYLNMLNRVEEMEATILQQAKYYKTELDKSKKLNKELT